MLILMITTNDPAGAAISHVNAINNFTHHTARLVTTETRYNFDYKFDLHLPHLDDYSEVEYLLKHSDVFHFHMTSNENSALGPFKIKDYIRNKLILHHHHGEPAFRYNPDYFRSFEIKSGRKSIVSTPDLKLLYPEAYWLPNVVPLNNVHYLPSHKDSDTTRITHSPTRRNLKNTDIFIDVMTKILSSSNYDVRYQIIENTPNIQCLKIKRQSDIFFDHMQGYYGISSLEALSQGVACIAGLSEHTVGMIREFTGCESNPWIVARNKEELELQITGLIRDRNELIETKKASREWMNKYWNEQKIAQLYLNILTIND